MSIRTLPRSVLRAVDLLSDKLAEMMPPLEPTSDPRPRSAPKAYRPPGPDVGLWFMMLLSGVVIWGLVIALLMHRI